MEQAALAASMGLSMSQELCWRGCAGPAEGIRAGRMENAGNGHLFFFFNFLKLFIFFFNLFFSPGENGPLIFLVEVAGM